MKPTIPPDFPRDLPLGSVAGAQPKLLVYEVDGKFVAGPTNEQVQARYAICADLVEQLERYCHRKRRENPDIALPTLLQRIGHGVRKKDWQLSDAEVGWIMNQLYSIFDVDSAAATPKDTVPARMLEALFNPPIDTPHVKTIIEAAEERLSERLAKMRRGEKP